MAHQLALPSLAALITPTPAFAHPFERHFARLLDSYRLRWSYEPTTFLLSRRPDGSLEECFTPDFYLPDLATYVELTSMRQPLVTRKHRKLRRFQLASPGTRVVMLYRRDYHRLLSAWSRAPVVAGVAPGQIPTGARLLYADQRLNEHLGRLAWNLGERYAALGEEPLLIGLGVGGGQVARDLAERLVRSGSSPTVESLLLDDQAGRPARLGRDGTVSLTGRVVTLVTTMVSTGLTTTFAAGWLRRRGTAAIDVCALLDRASARVVSIPFRYEPLAAPVEHLIGFGLEHRRQYRHLPSIAVLDTPYDGPLLSGPA